jgi:hypothetical protein
VVVFVSLGPGVRSAAVADWDEDGRYGPLSTALVVIHSLLRPLAGGRAIGEPGQMQVIPEPAHQRFGVFSRTEALAAGWTGRRLDGAVARGELIRPHRGVYRTPVAARSEHQVSRTELCAKSAAAVLSTSLAASVSHEGAAALNGLPVLGEVGVPCITVRPRRSGDIANVHLHRAQLPSSHLITVHSMSVTSPARTVIDLGRDLGIGPAVVAADAALNLGIMSLADLECVERDCARWPGISRARAVRPLADARAESPLETLSRLRLVDAKFPAPDLQTVIRRLDGEFVGRVDFYWDQFGIVGEADGRLKYQEAADLYAEKRRQEQLEELGLVVVRWSWSELASFDQVRRRLARASQRGLGPGHRDRRWLAEPASSRLAT